MTRKYSSQHCSSQHTSPRWAWCLSAGILLFAAGCVTPWERSSLMGGRNTTIDNVQGPNERRLRNLFWKQEQEDYLASNGSLKPIPGTEDYLQAEELYEQKEYAEAKSAFHKVAKKYKKSDIREDALFMKGESAYQLGHYASAQDEYSRLLRDYPSTRHLDDVSKRLFEIARIWLDFPEQAQVGEVQQVDYDNFGNKLPAETPVEKQSWGVALWPNLTDKSRPLFDPEGNGVGALRLIWLNDPTGPLADDALMLAASHYARTGNFIESDRHYTLLREEYPNSPHVQNAFVLGSHVKLMSYEGPDYDSKSLEDSEQLKRSILRLYPNLEDRERVEQELQKIENAKAAREWEQVVFHEKKGNARGQAIYCHLLLQRFPNTPYAKLARERLQELGPQYANGQKLLQLDPDPPKYRQTFNNNRTQLSNIPSSIRERQAAAVPAEQQPPAEPPVESAPETPAEPARPRRFLPWGNDEEAKPVPTPSSPGEENLAPAMPEQTVSGEEAPTESGSRWSRMFRFTPPRRLAPEKEAQPINEDAEEEATESESSGNSSL